MKRNQLVKWAVALAASAVITVTFVHAPPVQAQNEGHDCDSRVEIGFQSAPVHLNLEGKNRASVHLLQFGSRRCER